MSDERFDPWRTLGVPVGATPGEIRAAWRRIARRLHPDVSRDPEGAHEEFIRARQAYEMLIDDELRARLESQALSADVDDLIIIDDLEVMLDDAWELLRRGYIDEARDLYLKLARDHAGDPRLLELLDAIRRVREGAVTADLDARPAAQARREPAAGPTWETYREIWMPEPRPVRWWLPALGLLIVAGCVAAVRNNEATPVLLGLSAADIGLRALAGFMGAALAAAGGLLRSFDFELGGAVSDHGGVVPMWLYLGVAGIISPLLALVFYLVFVLFEVPLSWQILGFFAAVYVIAGAMAWAEGGSTAVMLTFGASVIFVSALIGWAIGSMFRPGHWWE